MDFWKFLSENLLLAILVVVAIIICGADLIKAIGVWRQRGEEKLQKNRNLTDDLKKIQESLELLHNKVDKQDEHLNDIDVKIRDLTDSDMHDIKSWIVDKYHIFFEEQGWIDAFNADTIDKRYEDYKKEGGNSYIDTLMERLHSLPMDPEFSIHKNK